MIRYTHCYERWSPEDVELGATDDQGIIEGNAQATFREMVKALEHCDRIEGSPRPWFADVSFNEGTREWYEEGIREARSYHPATPRDLKWMTKAWKASNP